MPFSLIALMSIVIHSAVGLNIGDRPTVHTHHALIMEVPSGDGSLLQGYTNPVQRLTGRAASSSAIWERRLAVRQALYGGRGQFGSIRRLNNRHRRPDWLQRAQAQSKFQAASDGYSPALSSPLLGVIRQWYNSGSPKFRKPLEQWV